MTSTRDRELLIEDFVNFFEKLVFPITSLESFEEDWKRHKMEMILFVGTSVLRQPQRPDIEEMIFTIAASYVSLLPIVASQNVLAFGLLCLFELFFTQHAACSAQAHPAPRCHIRLSIRDIELLRSELFDPKSTCGAPREFSSPEAAQQHELLRTVCWTLEHHCAFEIVPFVDNAWVIGRILVVNQLRNNSLLPPSLCPPDADLQLGSWNTGHSEMNLEDDLKAADADSSNVGSQRIAAMLDEYDALKRGIF